jgi:transcriptional regulator with XRE-family HTH domain
MSHRRPPEYVRTCRRSWALSQSDVAFLIGATSRTQVSRYERRLVRPPASMIFALSIVFGENAIELFPRACGDIEEEVLARAAQLHESLQGKPGTDVKRKLDCLEAMLERACERNRQSEV